MKFAILLDGGYFRATWQKHKSSKYVPQAEEIDKLVQAIKVEIESAHPGIRLLRTYFYDCDPYGGQQAPKGGATIDFSTTNQFRYQQKLLADLTEKDSIAIRKGEIKFRGWDYSATRPTPIFAQKGVDMKIGLDAAWLATKRIVDAIVLVSGDSDFIAPMKLARTEGVEVWICGLESIPYKSLIEHSDRKFIYSF